MAPSPTKFDLNEELGLGQGRSLRRKSVGTQPASNATTDGKARRRFDLVAIDIDGTLLNSENA